MGQDSLICSLSFRSRYQEIMNILNLNFNSLDLKATDGVLDCDVMEQELSRNASYVSLPLYLREMVKSALQEKLTAILNNTELRASPHTHSFSLPSDRRSGKYNKL